MTKTKGKMGSTVFVLFLKNLITMILLTGDFFLYSVFRMKNFDLYVCFIETLRKFLLFPKATKEINERRMNQYVVITS
jgi:hypothetical protein